MKGSLTLKNRERQWEVRKPRFFIDEKQAKEMFLRFCPGIWDELAGLRDALEWPMEKVLREFGGYRLDGLRSGCSILAGKNFLVRNYDYHPKTYEGRYLLFQPTDGKGYATVGPSQKITGRMDGMNEKGLVVGYNFTNRKKPKDGFVCFMIGRILLETCADAEEALALLKEIPHRHSFSYVVFDKSCVPYVAEASPRGIGVRQANVCTNHFEILTEENRHYLDDSLRRMERMAERKRAFSDAGAAFRLLNGTGNGVFSKQYASWAGTIHTSAYFPREMKAWFALGGDREPAEIDFAKWLSGENVKLDRFYGEVDTDLPFVHMDEGADWYHR